jgi:hypothetical protein
MTGINPILNELNELNSSLPAYVNEPVFSLPNDYFENFAASVLERIKANEVQNELSELSPLLAGVSKKSPFAVPENYFGSLDAEMLIKQEDEILPAILSGHNKEMPFAIPARYFHELPGNVISKIPREAKVISINAFRVWKRMAVAAVITGIMAVSGLVYFTEKGSGPSVQSQAWFKSKLNNVSDGALEEFIHNTDAVHEQPQSLAKSGMKPQEVKTMLSDVSVKDMDAFLDQVPTDDEELSVIN